LAIGQRIATCEKRQQPFCGASDMPNDQIESTVRKPSIDAKASTSDLRKASEELKARIAEARSRNDMPVDSALGNPNWEKHAADRHLDVPDDDGDE
jgi:hypothetical protein